MAFYALVKSFLVLLLMLKFLLAAMLKLLLVVWLPLGVPDDKRHPSDFLFLLRHSLCLPLHAETRVRRALPTVRWLGSVALRGVEGAGRRSGTVSSLLAV